MGFHELACILIDFHGSGMVLQWIFIALPLTAFMAPSTMAVPRGFGA